MPRIISAVLVCAALCAIPAEAQPKLPGQWSIMGFVGIDRGVAAGMRGTLGTFAQQFDANYSNVAYPFADRNGVNTSIGGHLAYRFPNCNISALIGEAFAFFQTSDGIFSNYDMSMFVSTLMLGAEYTLGLPGDRWNAFGRFGVDVNGIGGTIDYQYYYTTTIPITIRMGFETEVGGRYNLACAPLAVELSVNYTDANIVGKRYATPVLLAQSNVLKKRELNDAANPNDPNDHPRVIDYLSLRLGGRIWF